ncbi:MAG TPA: hypothetical protein VFK09_10640 [Gemmatimonadales bacterium]|jgi:hypothetical protein|nr:hypothetical protein [Gemmatimonadales bacterium]
MASARPTPFDLVFAPLAEERFPAIRAALEAAGGDPRNRDAFLLTRDAAAVVRELRPDEGLGEGIDQLAALVHHAYLFWAAGSELVSLPGADFQRLLASEAAPRAADAIGTAAPYVQIPERQLWARPIEGAPFEALDGWFAHLAPGDRELSTLAVFGLHPDRMGFTVVEALGPRPAALARPDGSPLFSPTLPGGAAAGLSSIAGVEELLELAWRARDLGES